MKLTNLQNLKNKSGMTLLELTVVILVLLSLISILFIGALVLGAGTLRDISLALFIGIIVGTYSTIFIAAPLYAQLRSGEDSIKKRDKRTAAVRRASVTGATNVTT